MNTRYAYSFFGGRRLLDGIIPLTLMLLYAAILLSGTGCGCECNAYDENCFDLVDNDGDGQADCDDAECILVCSFQDSPGTSGTSPLPVPETNCSDGIDNNDNGLTDCADPFCAIQLGCQDPPPGLEVCDNGVDDNDDGRVDCEDLLCGYLLQCRELYCPTLSQESCLTPAGTFAYSSSAAYPRHGESLRSAEATQISGVRWWGAKTSDAPQQFVLTYHLGQPAPASAHSLPGAVIATYAASAASLAVHESAYTPPTNVIVDDDGDGTGTSLPLVEYEGTHDPLPLQANTCYLVVIHDESNGFAWAGAVEFDGSSSLKIDETAAWSPATATDLSLCPLYTVTNNGGACCFTSSGMCYDNTPPSTCTELEGLYRGDGSACAASPPCAANIGACCTDSGCFVVPEVECTGFYRGDGTTCPPNPPCP